MPTMIEIDLDSVNVTSAKDKFVDVVKKVIDQQTTAPPTPPPEHDDEDEDEPDEHETTPPSKMTPTPPPVPTTARVTLPPVVTTARPGSASSLPGSNGNSNLNGSAASDASTKIGTEPKDGGSGPGVIISVAVVFCLAVVAVAVFIVRRRKAQYATRSKALSDTGNQQSTRYAGNATVLDDTNANFTHMPNTKDLALGATRAHRLKSSSTLAEDDEIAAVRIPMEKIEFGQLLSRGGFGEVHQGTYKGTPVAIKRLLPERRKDRRQIEGFLAEAKMMATLDHERIVQFIGVAWDSLSEVCVVSEFMDGGDLRSVLSRWETTERRMHGFDHDKIKIALHVAHAMTYLHSMQPMILHRDLKSKNILLSHDFDAKLTDFGVSRERVDATMTAGVGSSLWMAPEVMLGERYDEKADVFSFGVVLSELDTHLHPYSHATEPGTGRKIPDTAILQMVTLGRLTVEFTASADPELVALGRDCVAVDPKARPTAGEALHRVHQVWRSCISL